MLPVFHPPPLPDPAPIPVPLPLPDPLPAPEPLPLPFPLPCPDSEPLPLLELFDELPLALALEEGSTPVALCDSSANALANSSDESNCPSKIFSAACSSKFFKSSSVNFVAASKSAF